MPDSFIVDTNIIVYAYDESEKEKREKCFKLIKSIFNGEMKAYVTNQIIAEVFITLLKKIDNPSPLEYAQTIIDSIIESENWKKINYSYKTVSKAAEIVKKFNMPFWDALITSTMIEHNVFAIYTEDTKHFNKIPRLKVVNPFS